MQKQLRHSDLLYQKKESQRIKKSSWATPGETAKKTKKEITKAHQGAPQKKAANASGRKTRMEVTECKNSFAIRIYCIKKGVTEKQKSSWAAAGETAKKTKK